MIFDEATSALDAESEYQVQKAIDRLVEKKERTMVIVAHRLSTIINCDRILVLKHGEIVESGSHKELLGQKGVYAALVERQLSNLNE